MQGNEGKTMEKKRHQTVDFKILKESRMGQVREDSERFHRYHEFYYIAEGNLSGSGPIGSRPETLR